MITRYIQHAVEKDFFRGKAILLFGARQVGKTTLVKSILSNTDYTVLYINGDEADVADMFIDATSVKLQLLFGNHSIVIIDEAQKIQNIGTILKLCVDTFPKIQIIATGSSAFELANSSQEPLTGRKFEYTLFPFSFQEMVQEHGFIQESRMIEHRLIYGYYPEIVTHIGEEERLLKLVAHSYLYKDLLLLEQIKRPLLIEKILKALALQIGSEVSYNELAQLVGSNPQTVEKYIEVLEKAYIVFKLPALSKNVRNEIKKGKKIYFYDTGIRNAIIGNFNSCSSRTDVGALWENFVVSERVKKNIYESNSVNMYFWRTTQQQEIDFIEEKNGIYTVFECKWKKGTSVKISKTFTDAYTVDQSITVTPQNIEVILQ